MRNSNPRGYAERKRLTKRKIKKRLSIVDSWNEHTPSEFSEFPNKLNKNNLSCGCGLCKPHKHHGNKNIASNKRPTKKVTSATLKAISEDE